MWFSRDSNHYLVRRALTFLSSQSKGRCNRMANGAVSAARMTTCSAISPRPRMLRIVLAYLGSTSVECLSSWITESGSGHSDRLGKRGTRRSTFVGALGIYLSEITQLSRVIAKLPSSAVCNGWLVGRGRGSPVRELGRRYCPWCQKIVLVALLLGISYGQAADCPSAMSNLMVALETGQGKAISKRTGCEQRGSLRCLALVQILLLFVRNYILRNVSVDLK